MIEATTLVWRAAGCPVPCDVYGQAITRARQPGSLCARCGTGSAPYDVDELLSANFVPTKNANRIASYGGRGYCAACVFAARTLRLRCISWFTSSSGIVFWTTRSGDPIARLLDPPPPPFVCSIPTYGIAHGGEAHWQRTWWPGESHADPLVKLQSKHVALYARVAMSRDRYPVQVDDAAEFLLDRDAWLLARDAARSAMSALVADGVPPARAVRAARSEPAIPSFAGHGARVAEPDLASSPPRDDRVVAAVL